MRKGFESEQCAFCNLDRGFNEVLWEDTLVFAWVVPEQYKRAELAYHALIVPKRHVRFETELTDEENASVLAAKRFMHEKFDYRGGLTHVREGDMSLNAGTVPHLHYNTFMPNGTGEVRVPVFKDPGDREANVKRAMEFANRYKAGEVPD